jgi:hypothetical protein
MLGGKVLVKTVSLENLRKLWFRTLSSQALSALMSFFQDIVQR